LNLPGPSRPGPIDCDRMEAGLSSRYPTAERLPGRWECFEAADWVKVGLPRANRFVPAPAGRTSLARAGAAIVGNPFDAKRFQRRASGAIRATWSRQLVLGRGCFRGIAGWSDVGVGTDVQPPHPAELPGGAIS
jgi:hypothetical protein